MKGSGRAKRTALVTVIFVSVALKTSITNTLNPAARAPLYEHPTADEILHQKIETNKKSHIAADVKTIIHIPSEAKIVAHFHRNRSCSHPQLIGRLSGLFLSKVKWEDRNVVNTNGEYVVVGHYNVPSPGKYFIEVIVTMCTQLDMDVNVTNICMVDPANHRITHLNATVDTEIESANEIGVWFSKMKNYNSTPLYTRYQPPGCLNNPRLASCTGPSDVTRFDPYEFKFLRSFSLKEQLYGKAGRACFVGASHSRVLTQHSNSIIKKLGINNFTAYHQDLRFAANLTQVAAEEMANRCTRVVVGMGQWDVSRAVRRPTSFVEYEKLLNEAMLVFVKTLLDANVGVYFRNMHYNPLYEFLHYCPPRDWRNPNVVDMYSMIVKHLCENYDVPFIDTSDITGVMWDRHADWGHFEDVSGELEALYLLHRIFS